MTTQQRKRSTCKAAYRSGLEEKTDTWLRARGVKFSYETLTIPYTIPESTHKYTPDFCLENGVIVETKGLFTSEDRKKMLLVKAQHPGLDIRLVFSNAMAKIAKKSKTTYAKWAEDHGFLWGHKEIPTAWLTA